MQTFNDQELIETEQGEEPDLADKLFEKMKSGEATHGVIGKMPKKGKEVKINGLLFVVQQISKSGNVILELKKP